MYHRASRDTITRMNEAENVKPRVAWVLEILGWVLVVASPIIALASAAAASSDTVGTVVFVGVLLGGLCFSALILGFAKVIVKLCEIEVHVRRGGV